MPFVEGNEILSYCPYCQKDRDHTVTSVVDKIVQKVRCNVCNQEHTYKKPKQKEEEKEETKQKKKEIKTKAVWEELMANRNSDDSKEYKMVDDYYIGELINHKSFGLGVITKLINPPTPSKIEVVFESGMKILVCNRK